MKNPINLNFILAVTVIFFSLNVMTEAKLSKPGTGPSHENDEAVLQKSADLFSAVRSGTVFNSGNPDLTDFRNKAQHGLDFMNNGSSIKILRFELLSEWSESISESLLSYLNEIYKDNKEINSEQGRVNSIVNNLKENQSHPSIMYWEIENSGKVEIVNSVAVFDKDWNVLFDTRLMNFIVSTVEDETTQEDGNTPNSATAIKNIDHQTISRLNTVDGTFGSIQLYTEVRVTAVVSPYILESTNDAEYNYYTEWIICERRNPSGIPPQAEPFVWFGINGSWALLYNNAVPYQSPVKYTQGTGDGFNGGTYTINGSNGLNWSFEFDFSVDFPGGSIGITPVSNISPLSLGAVNNSQINLLNSVYYANVVTGDVRALFYDGGSLNLDNFYVRTVNSPGEIEKINISSRLQKGYYTGNIANGYVFHTFPQTAAATINFPVTYLRGNHVLQPEYELTSTRYSIAVGQIDTLKAKITNKSHAVQLNGGNISIDVSSLNGCLTLLSPATMPIGTIDTSASKVFKFVVQGSSNGVITPQANISSMGWSSPVPPYLLINNIVSINSNIDVGPLTKTLSLSMLIQGFYDQTSNAMVPDTARVYLRNTSSPYAIADSSKAVLNLSGAGTFTFTHAANLTPYYIQLKHRNSIETWSSSGNVFTGSSMTYDYTTSASQAFGNNMKQVDASPVRFAIYSGDENQDGIVDATDIIGVYNDASLATSGYVATDITGDNFVDASDILVTYNNAFNSVSTITP